MRDKCLCISLLAGITLTATALPAAGEEAVAGNTALLTIGRDNQGNQLIDAALLVPVHDTVLLEASAGANGITDVDTAFTTNDYRLGISSMQTTGFNLHVSTRFWGEQQAIESSDLALQMSYQSATQWRTSVLLERGDVTLYLDPSFSSTRTSVSSDRSAWGIDIGHSGETGAWWLSYINRDYERNLALINSNRVLQSVIKSFALDQSYALTSDEYTLGYEWYFERYDVGVQFNRVISVVDESADDYVSLTYRYYADDSISVQGSLQDSLDDDLIFLSVGLGILW